MKKLFNRKNTTTVIVFALILVLNIVMLCLPAFGAYKGSVKSDNSTTTYTLEYKGNDEIKLTYAKKGGNSEGKTSITYDVKYNATDKAWEESTISTKITKRNSVFAHTYYYGVNKELKVTSALAIVLQVVFAVGYVVCVLLVVLGGKKGGLKRKKKSRR